MSKIRPKRLASHRKTCRICKDSKTLDEFKLDKNGGHRTWMCLGCEPKYAEHFKAKCRERSKKSRAIHGSGYVPNPEAAMRYRATAIAKHGAAEFKRRLSERSRRHLRKLREALLDKYGRVCKRCGHTDARVLQIDHVHGGGSLDRRSKDRHKYYRTIIADTTGEFQLLCANCNWLKRLEHAHERGGLAYDPAKHRI